MLAKYSSLAGGESQSTVEPHRVGGGGGGAGGGGEKEDGEMPEEGTTKSLLAKFKKLQSSEVDGSVVSSPPKQVHRQLYSPSCTGMCIYIY